MTFSKFKQAKDQISQMRELKKQADEMQKQLATIEVEADAGHGAVRVTVNGAQKVLSVKIQPKAMNPDKPEQLEDLVVKAVNEGISKAQKAAAKQMMASGNFKLPGMGG
jgi:DNA-binding YbaB/EbfC family protein